MTSVKKHLIALRTLAVVVASAYAQAFDNVVVDGSSGDQSETSIAIRLSKFLMSGCGPTPRKRISMDTLTFRGGAYNPDITGSAGANSDEKAKPQSDDANGALVSREKRGERRMSKNSEEKYKYTEEYHRIP
jgi:hypothetical protein